jgi:hypothetical protein
MDCQEVSMNPKMIARLLLLGCLVLAALSCNYVTNMIPGYKEVATGQAMITQMNPGAIASQVGGIVTQVDVGALATQAGTMATQIGPMMSQVAPMMSEMAPQITEMMTQMAPLETQMAPLTTQLSTSEKDVPSDIPVMQGNKNGFVASPQAISFFVGYDFKTVLSFYQTEMPKNGWTLVEAGTRVGDTDAELHFEKAGRKAVIVLATIPFVNQTTVVITLQ